MTGALRGATVLAAVGCAGVGGVFLAFSSFVMRGLEQLPASQGIAAMQSINVAAVRPVFMTALFGTALLCLYVGIEAVRTWSEGGRAFALVGACVYVGGAVVLTMVHHVPLNDSLAGLDPTTSQAPAEWAEYLRRWTTGNHVRTVAGLAAGGLLMISATRR